MTTQQTALQLAARHLVEAQEQVAVSMRGTDVAERRMLWEKIGPLETTLNALGQALEAAGATAPTEGHQGTPPPARDSLEALRRIEESRDEGVSLEVILKYALMIAERLDKKRGNWVGDMASTAQGETSGTDYAEAIQAMVLRLQGELGAEGEGRE